MDIPEQITYGQGGVDEMHKDLAFVGGEEAMDMIVAHINNLAVHVTAEEKEFWNRKLNVTDTQEVEGETLIFNRN